MVNKLTISIVIPVYNEAPVLPLLFAGLEASLAQLEQTQGTVEVHKDTGEYLGRTYEQVKQRPLYIIADVQRGGGTQDRPLQIVQPQRDAEGRG